MVLATVLLLAASAIAEEEDIALVPGWPADAPPGSKRLIFIRHAQGWHNKDARELPNYHTDQLGMTETYWDARLTPEGEMQAGLISVKMQWRQASGIPQLIAVSPLSRALHTAALGFPDRAHYDAPRPPVIATSLARERIGEHQCDRRRPLSDLKTDFPFVNFSELSEEHDEMWMNKEMQPGQFNSTACSRRAEALLRWLHARAESYIAVVTHWVFLTHLFALFPYPELLLFFDNAEMRFACLVPKAYADAVEDRLRQEPPGERDEL